MSEATWGVAVFFITLSKDLQPCCPIFSCHEIKEQRWMLVRPDLYICRGYQHTHISSCEVTWATNFLCKEVISVGYTAASAVCLICNLATQERFLPQRVEAHKAKSSCWSARGWLKKVVAQTLSLSKKWIIEFQIELLYINPEWLVHVALWWVYR